MNIEALNTFLSDLDSISLELIQTLKDIDLTKLSDVELYKLVNAIDFYQELNDLGYETKVTDFLKVYENDIVELINLASDRGLDKIGYAPIDQLETLKQLSGEEILRSGSLYSTQLKKNLLTQIIQGKQTKEYFNKFLNQINETVPFKPNWLTAAITTSYSEFNALATAKVFEDLPETRYKLVGPDDKVTREACHYVLMNQPKEGVTKEQIDAGYFPYVTKHGNSGIYTFVKRGGYSCRHQFRVV
jgi:hypothetical protein